MKLKVAAWNMAHWSHRNVATQAWNYLENEIASDITLLQESFPPEERQKEFCVWREIGGKRKWGSAVLTKKLPVAEIKLERNDYPGALTVAEVALPNETKLVVISMYGLMDEYGYSITTLHRMLSDLTHLFNGELRPGGRPKIILGGDLNASVQFDAKQRNQSHRIFFQRLEDFGLVDCQGSFDNNRPRTLRHNKTDFPWVNDYMFASKSLLKKPVIHEVVEKPDMHHLSDHNPLVATFEF